MKKPKKVNFEYIQDTDSEPYKLLAEVRLRFHDDIRDASVALAWRLREKADPDGRLVLGKCIKVSDLYKEFSAYDFIILLNREVWNDIGFTKEKKLALLDHELCHAAPDYDDETGESKRDDRGRRIFRIRKHDIEEFSGVVQRHGLYKHDLERFAEVLLQKAKSPLFNNKAKDETTVQMGVADDNGKTEWTEPISVAEFENVCSQVGKPN